jgi:regulation of enolase protein 1 (concanavalin A-like superfamily)
MFDAMAWLNEPATWSVHDGRLVVVTDEETDFWQNTFYDFQHDNGHFMYMSTRGDFTAEVTFSGEWEALYDQAGLMLRVSEHKWVKAGVELTDGATHLSTVVTRDFSDWSPAPFSSASALTVRLTRHGSSVRVQHKDNDGAWQIMRLAYLEMPESVQVGVMCCSPTRRGLRVEFSDFSVGPAIDRSLHG